MISQTVIKTLKYNCEKKRRYESFAAARRGMAVCVLHSEMKPGAVMRVYKCEICGGWHFTSHGSRNYDGIYKEIENANEEGQN